MSSAGKKKTKKVIKPGKNVVASTADNLSKKLVKIIEQGTGELSLDFTGVKTVDPVGLGVIVAAHNSLKNGGAKLMLKNVPEEIYSLLCDLGMNQHFEVKPVS